MLGFHFVLEYHSEFHGNDRFATHIEENYFGVNRSMTKGKNSYAKVLIYFVKGEFDMQLIQDYELGYMIISRDNIGDVRFN